MSAGRNASSLLMTFVATLVLFAVFVAVTSIPWLARHSYDLGYGWQTKQSSGQPSGVCDRPLVKKGFPLATTKPADAADDPSGCLDSKNPLARDMTLALCFAAAAIISAATVTAIRQT